MGILATSSSAFHFPLDQILGTPSTVRILRILSSHGGFLPVGEIALRARLNRAGTGRTLHDLVRTGMVEQVGQTRSLVYRISPDHPLLPAISALFESEQRRVEEALREIKAIAAKLEPAPVALWLFGSTARQEDQSESDFDLALVGQAKDVAAQRENFWDQVFEAGQKWMFTPSVISLSTEDVRDMSRKQTAFWQNIARDARVVYGKSPLQVANGS